MGILSVKSNVKMVSYLATDKRTLLLIPADIVILTGVIYFDWNANRVVLFFGLDVGLSILSFVIYNIAIRGYGLIPNALIASTIVLVPLYHIVRHLLTPPYYDFATFLSFAVLAHLFDIRKYLSYKKDVAQPGFALYVGLLFLMIPVYFILVAAFQAVNVSPNLSLIIPFIAVRHFTEYKRYRKFIEIETEINRTQ